MIGDSERNIEDSSIHRIVIRDALLTFVITLIATLIANPPFHIDLIVWIETLYVPILTAGLTAIVSYAHAVGVHKRNTNE